MTTWSIEALTGYKPITTFWEDFTIAERFDEDAVRDTYDRAMDEWKSDYRYLTELVMVLNWKIWEHFDRGSDKLAAVYNGLWSAADKYACEHLTDEELAYFYDTTD